MPRQYAKRDYTILERSIPTEVLRHEGLTCGPDDTDLFYPDGPCIADIRKAQAICRRCPSAARRDCLLFALETRQRYGVWGATTSEDRLRLLKKAKVTGESVNDIAQRMVP